MSFAACHSGEVSGKWRLCSQRRRDGSFDDRNSPDKEEKENYALKKKRPVHRLQKKTSMRVDDHMIVMPKSLSASAVEVVVVMTFGVNS